MRTLCLLILLALLSACATPVPEPQAPAVEEPGPVVAPRDLVPEMAQLPKISILTEDPLQAAYPGETLFAAGSVLPRPESMEMLAPLAEFLRRHPETRWTVQVRAHTEFSADYDASLARTRGELLRRYLTRKGLAEGRFEFVAEAGAGPALELTLLQ